ADIQRGAELSLNGTRGVPTRQRPPKGQADDENEPDQNDEPSLERHDSFLITTFSLRQDVSHYAPQPPETRAGVYPIVIGKFLRENRALLRRIFVLQRQIGATSYMALHRCFAPHQQPDRENENQNSGTIVERFRRFTLFDFGDL